MKERNLWFRWFPWTNSRHERNTLSSEWRLAWMV